MERSEALLRSCTHETSHPHDGDATLDRTPVGRLPAAQRNLDRDL